MPIFVWDVGDVTIFTGARTGAGMDASKIFSTFFDTSYVPLELCAGA